VIVKKISLPSMSDQELAETIQKEAAQHIPFDLDDVNLDYQILSEDAGQSADGRFAGRCQEGQDS
jgi:type IV pilus assembly protein PilM